MFNNKKFLVMKTNINIKRIARSYYYENDIEVSIHSDEYRITLHYFYSLRDANGPQGINTIKAQAKAAAEAVGEIERGGEAFDDAIKQFHQIMVNNGQELNATPDFLKDIKKQETQAEQELTKGIINPYPTCKGIEFVYDDGGQGYFTSWAAMVDFWTKDYNTKAEADKVLRSIAVATILNDGEPICQRKKAGPISAQERSWLIAEAKRRINVSPVEVKDIDAEDANIITSFGNYAFQENGKTVFVANNQNAIDLDNDDEVNALAEKIAKFNETLIANGFVVENIVEKSREDFYYTSMPWDLYNPLVLKTNDIEQPTNKTNTSMKYTTTFVGWSVIAQTIAQVLNKDNQFRKFAEFRGLDLYIDGHSISVVNPKNGNSSCYELESFIQDDTLWLDRIAINIEDFAHYELGEAA